MKNKTCYCNKITILHSFYIYIYIKLVVILEMLIMEPKVGPSYIRIGSPTDVMKDLTYQQEIRYLFVRQTRTGRESHQHVQVSTSINMNF